MIISDTEYERLRERDMWLSYLEDNDVSSWHGSQLAKVDMLHDSIDVLTKSEISELDDLKSIKSHYIKNVIDNFVHYMDTSVKDSYRVGYNQLLDRLVDFQEMLQDREDANIKFKQDIREASRRLSKKN